MGGEIRSAFLSAFNLQKACYIATAGALAILVDATRIATYFAGGVTLGPTLRPDLWIFIVASLAGSALGRLAVKRIPQNSFRSVVAGFLFIAGLRLAISP